MCATALSSTTAVGLSLVKWNVNLSIQLCGPHGLIRHWLMSKAAEEHSVHGVTMASISPLKLKKKKDRSSAWSKH